MSYALAFTADSRVDFQELQLSLQELVLDELDRLASGAAPLPGGTFTHDFVHESPGGRHYVFLRLALDEPTRALLILGVAHHLREAR